MTATQVDHPADVTNTSRHTQREIMVPSAVGVVCKQTRRENLQRRVPATASMSDTAIATSASTRFAWLSHSSQRFYVGTRFTHNLVVAGFCL